MYMIAAANNSGITTNKRRPFFFYQFTLWLQRLQFPGLTIEQAW